jgi:hypothetical protein
MSPSHCDLIVAQLLGRRTTRSFHIHKKSGRMHVVEHALYARLHYAFYVQHAYGMPMPLH